ncbi:MAG: hypothetical protein AAB481_02235 [Patescibacteria group bacterium]
MGYYGRLELKLKAQEMRKGGRSYNEIIVALKLPKTTVSDWCKDIQLTKSQLFRLYQSKKVGALKGSIIAANRKKAKRIYETEVLYRQGIKDVGKLTKRNRFIAGIALYAAEGTKGDKSCAFANSDPAIIKFMVDWFKEFGNLEAKKFRAALWLHDNLDDEKAKLYWSRLTRIPVTNFYKTYFVKNKDTSKKIRKNIHSYGVITIYVSNVLLIRKLMGWIGGILQKPWYN